MILYFIFSICLTFAYLFLIHRYRKAWQQIKETELPSGFQPATSISVLVAARNEAAAIKNCITSILQQNYPPSLWELIVIDDYSTDSTADIVQAFDNQQLQLLQLEKLEKTGGKKNAIAAGIAHAKGDLIVCTDADCLVAVDWLQRLAAFQEQTQHQFIAAPVNLHQEANKFEQFQSLDLIGMMGVTAACIHMQWMHMCNGANLAYTKKAFDAVNGFEGIDQLASGDDMLLMQKIARQFPGQIGFLKNRAATVFTSAMPGWRSFFRQRLRWASKSRHYPEQRATIMLAIVFFFCVTIILNILLIPLYDWEIIFLSIFQLSVKIYADRAFLTQMSAYFGRSDLMKNFGYAQVLHIFYIAIVGLLSNFKGRYEWKGRQLR